MREIKSQARYRANNGGSGRARGPRTTVSDAPAPGDDGAPISTDQDGTDLPFRIDLSLAMRSSVVGLFLLAVFYTIYFTRPVLLPIMIGVLLALVLAPVVNVLEKVRVPRWLGSALTLVALVLLIGYGTWRTLGPASEWFADLPVLLTDARDRFDVLLTGVGEVSEAAEQVQEITEGEAAARQQVVTVDEPSFGERALALGRAFLGGSILTFALVYFLLVSGELFLLKLVRVLPNLTERKRGVSVAVTLRENLSHYFLTIAVVNGALGALIGLAMWLLDMPNPAVWGVMAALLNFIPYLGAAAGVGVVSLVGLATFDGLLAAAAPGLIYLGLTALEGTFVTPALLGRRMRMNPVAILLSLILWGWMWGVPGMLVAVPVLAGIKVFADAYPGLNVLSEFLGR